MNKQHRIAQVLIAFGSFVLLLGSALHLIGGYPLVLAGLMKSNLAQGLRDALRSVFILIALNWIAIVVVTLIATFSKTRTSKPMVLFCGFALLLQIPIWVACMGWFVGNAMFLVGSGLVVCGALLFRGPSAASDS